MLESKPNSYCTILDLLTYLLTYSIALQADYVTVVEVRPKMSANIVSQLHDPRSSCMVSLRHLTFLLLSGIAENAGPENMGLKMQD